MGYTGGMINAYAYCNHKWTVVAVVKNVDDWNAHVYCPDCNTLEIRIPKEQRNDN